MITGRLTKKGFEITRFVPTKEQSALGKLYEAITRASELKEEWYYREDEF